MRLREDNSISNHNCTVYDFESNYLDLETKTRHVADSVVGHEKRSMALKQRCAETTLRERSEVNSKFARQC